MGSIMMPVGGPGPGSDILEKTKNVKLLRSLFLPATT
jgi:hypothetical protein